MDAVSRPDPPYLWGDWRASANPDFFTAECQVCGGELWLNWAGERWQVSCAGGCTPQEIDRAARWQKLLKDTRELLEEHDVLQAEDPLYCIDAAEFVAALAGREVDRRGFAQCPFHGDGAERTPSLHVSGPFWYCHGCHVGGTIYDFAGRLWDVPLRGRDFIELRERVNEELIAWGG